MRHDRAVIQAPIPGRPYQQLLRAAERGEHVTPPGGGHGDPPPAGGVKAAVARLRARPGVAHLIRAAERFTDRLGNQFGAAVTYFSFLSVVPILMVAFSIASFVLRGNDSALETLKQQAAKQVPGSMMSDIIDKAVASGLAIGIVGLVLALYSGVGWMANVRDAVQAQWRPTWGKTSSEKKQKFYVRYGLDLLTLVGLGLGMLVSFVLTATGSAAQKLVLGWLHLDQIGWLKPVFSVVPFVLAIGASTLVFAWFYRMMRVPEYTPPKGTVLKGALIAAVGFEVLKVALALVLPRVVSSPTGAVFGPLIGLLLFFNLVGRVVLFVAAWIGTADPRAAVVQDLPEVSGPTNVEQAEQTAAKARWAGLGAAAGFVVGRRVRRR